MTPKLQEQAWRSDFETWMRSQNGLLSKNSAGRYESELVNAAWLGYVSGRRAAQAKIDAARGKA